PRDYFPARVGGRMCHIEVVGLRAGCRNVFSASFLNVLFAFRYPSVVVAYANNLRHSAEKSRKRLDHGWGKFYGPLFACDVRRARVSHEPSDIRVDPDVETVLLNRLDHSVGHAWGEILLIDDRCKVGLDQHAPIKGSERLSEF